MADMTIAVYKINRATGERTVTRPRQAVKPREFPEVSSEWPKCICLRCHNSRTEQTS